MLHRRSPCIRVATLMSLLLVFSGNVCGDERALNMLGRAVDSPFNRRFARTMWRRRMIFAQNLALDRFQAKKR